MRRIQDAFPCGAWERDGRDWMDGGLLEGDGGGCYGCYGWLGEWKRANIGDENFALAKP